MLVFHFLRQWVALYRATGATSGTPRCGQRRQESTNKERPMKSLLVINSSAAREGSVSRTLVEDAVANLQEQNPFVTIVRRDLGTDPVPHLTTDTLNGVRGTPTTPAEQKARALSNELIAELRGADTVVIGAPMYNFGVTTGLRSWFDYVLRAGETFSNSAAGP